MGEKGLVHIYTGNGKGKTTAALGLCFRAAGYGCKCAFIQFLKKRETGESFSCRSISPQILFEQYGAGDFITGRDAAVFVQHRQEAEKGILRAQNILESGEYNIVVLDEIVTLPALNVAGEEQIIGLMELERGAAELVLTGRGAGEELIRRANLVTEMKEIKHYYNSGVPARKGIEY